MEDRLPRKLAAILYADVAGYSRLTGADEDATHRILSDYLDVISNTIGSNRGQVMHYAGDAALAKFDAVVDAMSAAVAIQNELKTRNEDVPDERKVQFRIGVNLGDVIEDRDDIYGDGVNVAARLESLAEPGGVCISDAVRSAIGKKLNLDYEDMGEQEVKNIAEPVRAYKVVMDTGEVPTAAAPEKSASQLPDKPSIAVLPFTNMSGDQEQEYFSDGITEDIITELTKFRSLSVIGRNSSFSYKGRAVNVQEVADDLGVQYVVEGSVRKAGNRLRITAQLIETLTGNHVWAQRYDRQFEDIFDVQDDVSQTIVATIAGRLDESAAQRVMRKPTEHMTAYDFFLRGLQQYNKHAKRPFIEARRFFQKALELDANYARAHAYMALTIFTQAFYVYTGVDDLDEALVVAERALALDNDEPLAHAAVGLLMFMQGRDNEGIASLRRSLALNPHDPELVYWLGFVLTYVGKPEEGIEWLRTSLRLNPLHGNCYLALGIALYVAKYYDEAIDVLKSDQWTERWSLCYQAAANAQLGRSDEAHTAAQQFVTNLQAELRERGEHVPTSGLELAQIETAFFRRQSDAEHLLDGLRKAGL